MNYEAGIQLKNRSKANAVRTAVRAACIQGVLASTLLVGSLAHSTDAPTTVRAGFVTPIAFDIPAQSLETALLRFSEQARIQVVVANGAASGAMAPQVRGEYSAAEALQLLLEESGLAYEVTDERTIAISADASRAKFEPTSLSSDSRNARKRTRVAYAKDDSDRSSASQETDSQTQQPSKVLTFEEVIVTGSHIRGAHNLSSPILRFDRAEIERSGYATTQEFLQSLPQNLNSVSDTTVGGVTGGLDWGITYDGTGVNLRGLGSDATLVLLNGRRLASAGNGSFVDISLIPLSAIERMEVLTDGASALYGSDAVGGVVNMTLRRDFSGAETRLRYGTVTQGSHDELQAGQTLGHAWDSGQALLSYEHYERAELDGLEREFFQPKVFENVIFIPNQKRQGALAVLSQRLTENVEISSDLFYSERESASGYDFGFLQSDILSNVTQYGGSVGLDVNVASDWQVRLSGVFDQSESDLKYVTPTTGDVTSTTGNESRLLSVDLAADGPLMAVPGGDVRLALGGQFRVEDFTEKSASFPAQLDRDVAAAYAEVLVPFVGFQNRIPGIERLELTLASRLEEYSDFGTTFNPKVGLAWAPIRGLNVRSTFGTSFKAPLLSQMNPGNVRASVYLDKFREASGAVTGMYLSGNGENLGPEESTNWTFGFDFSPETLEELSLSATYFALDYEDRIRTPFPSGYDVYGVLMDPLYAMVVDRDPNTALVAEYLVRPGTVCNTPQNVRCTAMPSAQDVDMIVDSRLRNLAGVRMSGIDISSTYDLDSRIGDWRFQLSGTYLLENREQLVPGAEETSEINNVWRPVDLRMRGSVSFTRGPLNTIAFVNYTDGYRDLRTSLVNSATQRSSVSSWTTVDLTLQYVLGQSIVPRWLGETTLTLSGVNLFDRAPPYIDNFYGVLFDGVNANPRGRFVSAQFVARW